MGLDIRILKGLKKVDNPELDEYGHPVNEDTQWKPGTNMKWSESIWPGREKPLSYNDVYEYEKDEWFYAGSYLGYNWWRAKLNEFSGNVAFQELIDFADNEGVIGSELSKKLYDDFRTYHNQALEFSKTINNGEWWFKKYCDWEEAFKMAKDGGAVEFG